MALEEEEAKACRFRRVKSWRDFFSVSMGYIRLASEL
jgi:hypothetical protein